MIKSQKCNQIIVHDAVMVQVVKDVPESVYNIVLSKADMAMLAGKATLRQPFSQTVRVSGIVTDFQVSLHDLFYYFLSTSIFFIYFQKAMHDNVFLDLLCVGRRPQIFHLEKTSYLLPCSIEK